MHIHMLTSSARRCPHTGSIHQLQVRRTILATHRHPVGVGVDAVVGSSFPSFIECHTSHTIPVSMQPIVLSVEDASFGATSVSSETADCEDAGNDVAKVHLIKGISGLVCSVCADLCCCIPFHTQNSSRCPISSSILYSKRPRVDVCNEAAHTALPCPIASHFQGRGLVPCDHAREELVACDPPIQKKCMNAISFEVLRAMSFHVNQKEQL